MSRQDRRATIIDVAARAGVSRQTVSRALNDMPGISGETRERVLAAAKELNYRPSRFGRGLVEQGPTTLGLVVVHAVFFGEDRYHLVLEPLLAVLACACFRGGGGRAALVPSPA